MNTKSSFVQFLNQKYPEISLNELNLMISDQLLSPFHVTLTQNTFEQLKTEIEHYQKLRNWSENNLQNVFETKNIRKPKNTAVCTSYDFHINALGQPKLIEINTNAAFLALGMEFYDYSKYTPDTNFSESELVLMFKNEINLSGSGQNQISIMDENPTEQRLYIEFLIYQQIFKKFQIKSQIIDINTNDLNGFKYKLLTSTRVFNWSDKYLVAFCAAQVCTGGKRKASIIPPKKSNKNSNSQSVIFNSFLIGLRFKI